MFVFVDGTIPIPKVDDLMYAIWEQCNTMEMTWLLNELSLPITQNVFWFNTARDN